MLWVSMRVGEELTLTLCHKFFTVDGVIGLHVVEKISQM